MNIKKIEIKNFRSVDDEGLEIYDFNKINLFIGKNNSGKSNILRFFDLLGSNELRSAIGSLAIGDQKGLRLRLMIDDHRDYSMSKSIQFSVFVDKPTGDFETRLMGIIPSDNIYVTYELTKHGVGDGSYLLKAIRSFIQDLPETVIRRFEEAHVQQYGGSTGGNLEGAQDRVARLLRINEQITFPKVEYLSEYRKPIDNQDLREKMNDIVNADYTNQANKAKKKLLCSYFKSVFDFEVDIAMPGINKEIELIFNEKQYPISSLGAGLQEVVLIAFMLVTTDAEIVCIDEPELHIHPGAQRELLNLVSTIEERVFFFATHSNHFLDYEVPNKKVYLLTKDINKTQITIADHYNKYKDILDDLGIRASEIYQTNGVIWVEGPSDRIYIKKWIELLSPSLKEGLQYTFQFYGGKVLSHYSVDDSEYKEYLNLLHINKNAFIVMDSDMSGIYQVTDLRDTKQRVITECVGSNIGYWVTKGKEIENYLSDRVLTEKSESVITRDIYKPIGEYCASYNKNKKVPFAREVTNILTIADIQENEDLEEKIKEIIEAIKKWNS